MLRLETDPRKRTKRRRLDRWFLWLCLAVTSLSVLVLSVLLITIFMQGWEHLDWEFLTGNASRKPEASGFKAAIFGSIWVLAICAVTALPLGIGTAVFLEEFRPRRRIERRAHAVIQLNIRNLAGVPSVVYGLLGLTLFARMFGLFGSPMQYARWDSFRTTDGTTIVGLVTENIPDTYRFETGALGTLDISDSNFAPGSARPDVAIGGEPRRLEGVASYDGDLFTIGSGDMRIEAPPWVVEAEFAEGEPFDGRVFTARVTKVADAAYAVATPDRGLVTVPASSIRDPRRDIDTVFVRRNRFTLADGRRLAGELIDATDAMITLKVEPGGELVTFGVADIRSYSRSQMFQIGDEDSPFLIRFPLGSSVLTGGLTLMLVVLPIVIISSQEALKAVPNSLREAALAMGCTRWQMVSRVTLPAAVPGIMTGAILAMSRAIGEAAPILVIGGAVFVTFTPTNLMDTFAAMPLQIYSWTGMPEEEFKSVAAAGIIVLLAVLLAFNATAVFIRQRIQSAHA